MQFRIMAHKPVTIWPLPTGSDSHSTRQQWTGPCWGMFHSYTFSWPWHMPTSTRSLTNTVKLLSSLSFNATSNVKASLIRKGRLWHSFTMFSMYKNKYACIGTLPQFFCLYQENDHIVWQLFLAYLLSQ